MVLVLANLWINIAEMNSQAAQVWHWAGLVAVHGSREKKETEAGLLLTADWLLSTKQ